jgi:nucleoside-diphosphate-sugar epimerase
MEDNLLIVGGSGFIGRNLAEKSLKAGFNITVISLTKIAYKKKIPGVIYIQADITNLPLLKEKLFNTSFNYVVNLSGYIDHSSYLDGGYIAINAHFNGLQNLLQVLDWSVLKRFVQIGSSDEYGNVSAPQFEHMSESPISSYSLGKLASAKLLKMLYQTENFPAVILRFFLVYGEGQSNKRFIPQIIQGCLLEKNFPVSEGGQLRDFCYIDDISSGILKSLLEDKALGEVINLASGISVSIRKVVEEIQNIIGTGSPEFGKIAYRKNENMELYANIDKAKTLLGWYPKVDLKQGLTKSIDFYKTLDFNGG